MRPTQRSSPPSCLPGSSACSAPGGCGTHAPTSPREFNAAKDVAIAGLVFGFALWFFGFMVVGGEWFQMWQSQTWNGQEAAFRFIGCIGLVLIFLTQKDDELA